MSPSPASPTIQASVNVPSASASVEADSLSRELFGSELENADIVVWNDLVSQKWQHLVRSGLVEDQRTTLFKKYSPPKEMDFLKAPRLNAECKSALKNNSVVKRDEFSCANQDQAGIVLFALGEAISDFLEPDIQVSLSLKARQAIVKVSEGAKILADLFYRLSISRRAQIKPTFNSTARSTADSIPADDFLFGTSFGEEIKKATSLEKSARDITKSTVTLSKKVHQPMKQTLAAPVRAGNFRAPASRMRSNHKSATGRSGASSRYHRSSSHSRSRSWRR